MARFRTDSNEGGVEKLAVFSMMPTYGISPPLDVSPELIVPETPSMVSPMSVFMVKGWARSFCATTVLLAAYESSEMLSLWPSSVREFFG